MKTNIISDTTTTLHQTIDMKKYISAPSIGIFSLQLLLAGCTKEDLSSTSEMPSNVVAKRVNNRIISSNAGEHFPLTAGHRFVSLCNRWLDIVDPPAGKFVLSMPYHDCDKKFGIRQHGIMNFEAWDVLTAEFSGVFADDVNTVKLYRIKRSDNKFLTCEMNLHYRELSIYDASLQQWLIADVGNQQYQLLLPGDEGNCRIAASYVQHGQYRIGGQPLTNNLNNTRFYFRSPYTIPSENNFQVFA